MKGHLSLQEVFHLCLLDVQANKFFEKQNLTFKIGASNVLNNNVLQVYGGPFVGRMIYASLSFDWKDK